MMRKLYLSIITFFNKNSFKIIILILILYFLFYYLQYDKKLQNYTNINTKLSLQKNSTTINKINITNKKEIIKNKMPPILIWNKCTDELFPGLGIGYPDFPMIFPNITCPFNCTFTHDKKFEMNASTIIFLIHPKCLIYSCPQHRREDQNYMMYTVESPVEIYRYYNKQIFMENSTWLNSSATYRLDSSIFMPYDSLTKITKNTPKEDIWDQKEILEKIKKKTKFAFQAVSNCNALSGRDFVTKKIGKRVNLTLVGKCSGVKCDDECYKRDLEQHFFYLAFENSVCPNYITEKFWNSLRALTVPIVLTRSIFKGLDIPPNAFIALDDFLSINELVEHLKALWNNTEEYLKYFEWTKTYTKTSFNENNFPMCKICEYATKHFQEQTKNTINLNEFWDDKHCKNDFLLKFIA